MAAGFVHGVLNTDNMNITGESFDYGPYRFLPHNDPNFTAAYFDQTGLYAFGRQPEAVFWNLQQLAGCLTLVDRAATPLVEALNGFGAAYQRGPARRDAGAAGPEAARARRPTRPWSTRAFRALAEGGEALRWEPFFFDWFCGDAGARPGRARARDALRAARTAFAGTFRERLAGASRPSGRERLAASLLRRGRAGGAALRRDRGDLGRHRRARRLVAVRRQARRHQESRGGLGPAERRCKRHKATNRDRKREGCASTNYLLRLQGRRPGLSIALSVGGEHG